jgi:hypothetical protein
VTEATSLRAHAFVLAVPDLDSSVSYFVNALGFWPEWRDGDDWQSLVRAGGLADAAPLSGPDATG